MAKVPEKAHQAHIVQLLRSVGGRVYVMGTHRRSGDYQGTMQTEGIPDVMAFLPTRTRYARDIDAPHLPPRPKEGRLFLFVEVKAQGGRLRPEQAEFKQLCADAKVVHLTGGLDDVIAWLVERGYIKADSVPHYRQPPAPEVRS